MTRELMIMRHCKSSWRDTTLPDVERPLNARGKADALAMGRLLDEQRLLPDLAISSPAKRARSTLKRLAKASHYRGQIRIEETLYHPTPSQMLTILSQVDDAHRRVLIVGHNPELEELVHVLTGQVVSLSTGAIVHLRLTIDTWHELVRRPNATLTQVLSPQSTRGPQT